MQKNLNLSTIRFFFDMKCVVKMVVAASYESVAGVSVENSSRSFWPPIARTEAFFLNGALGWLVTPSKVMQHSKFSSNCFQRLSMFIPLSKTASRSNSGTLAFRLARVFDIVLVNKVFEFEFWDSANYVRQCTGVPSGSVGRDAINTDNLDFSQAYLSWEYICCFSWASV